MEILVERDIKEEGRVIIEGIKRREKNRNYRRSEGKERKGEKREMSLIGCIITN